jgi:hypothetical protein
MILKEQNGQMIAFEMKWNPKKSNISIPETFLNAYDVKETVVITPENYLEYLL